MDKWLSNTTVVRIVALVIAVLLWAVVQFDEKPPSGSLTSQIQTMSISDVQLVYIGLDETQYRLQSLDPPLINLTLTGRTSSINRVNTLNYRVQVNLANIQEGTHSLPLEGVGFPPGVEVKILPSSVSVTIEKLNKKEVPVHILLEGRPADGFIAGDPIITPERVNVTLPSSMLDQVDSVSAKINIDGATEPIGKEVKLKAFDKYGNEMNLSITPSVVDVEVPITSPFVSLPIQLRFAGEPATGYSVASYNQNVNRITVYGPENVLNQFEFYEGPTIDLSGLNEDAEIILDIPLKPGVTQIQPTQVQLSVDVEPSVITTVSDVPISISGQNQHYDAVMRKPEDGLLDIQISGAPNLVEPVEAEDIQAIIDVSNLPPGHYELPTTLLFPNFITSATEEPYIVEVDILEDEEVADF